MYTCPGVLCYLMTLCQYRCWIINYEKCKRCIVRDLGGGDHDLFDYISRLSPKDTE